MKVAGRTYKKTQLLANLREAPHITELSLVSVSRSGLEGAIEKLKSRYHASEQKTRIDDGHSNKNDGEEPMQTLHFRIPCNVHTRQVKPNLTEREWKLFEERKNFWESGGYTYNDLKDKNDFGVEWTGVRSFLETLPKPVCIISHNGIKYDYRVLHAELERRDLLQSKAFPDEVFFVDSYLMLLDLEKHHHDELRFFTNLVDWKRIFTASGLPRADDMAEAAVFPKQDFELSQDQRISANDIDCNSMKSESPREENIVEDEDDLMLLRRELNEHEMGYSTPKKECDESQNTKRRGLKRRLFAELMADHPLQFAQTKNWSPARKKRIRPSLLKRTTDGDWFFDNYLSVQYFKERGIFKLSNLYEQLIGVKFDSHHAQDDCEALMFVCIAYAEEFLEYVDQRAVEFPF
ncbi:hypothetical protein AB6A40_001670 [Gnathostoma spinigerum]|uniref:Exonuclease domain-containing protein n=1 Tax=Gnathostoma spinigerum TaxID=75299 RepID=A0ABD6E5Z4_9BILA